MACDTKLKQGQTISQRKLEVRKAVERISSALAAGRIKPKVGANGGITFENLTDDVRDGVTDACVYRQVMVSGSALAKQAILRAEQMSGRSVNRQAIAQGLHSHDGGHTWHSGH